MKALIFFRVVVLAPILHFMLFVGLLAMFQRPLPKQSKIMVQMWIISTIMERKILVFVKNAFAQR